MSFFIIGIAYLPVAFGSPGPFERKTPFGLYSSIFSAYVLAGTKITSKFRSNKQFNIFCLIP